MVVASVRTSARKVMNVFIMDISVDRVALRSRNCAHAFDQTVHLFYRGIAGASCANQALLALAQSFHHRRSIKIAVRSEDALFNKSACDFDGGNIFYDER